MIYLDNAATTMMKPPQVAEAVCRAINSFGNVSRGVNDAALASGATVFQTRELLAELFHAPGPGRVAFTANVTESLNIVISGLLGAGDHAITTAASHNSVLRPLYRKETEEGVGLSIVGVSSDGTLDYDAFASAFKSNTRLAVVTHASNLTGTLYDIARLAEICHRHGALCVVDAAQTAGAVPLDMAEQGIDILCFTGHKSLYGPQGTGGLCLAGGVEIPPYKVGGSGIHTYDKQHPAQMPECFEAGTLNSHGIAGLKAGIEFVKEVGPEVISAKTHGLALEFRERVRAIPGITLYGRDEDAPFSSIVALNVGDLDSSPVADWLAERYGIAVRAGGHCAPLMHRALGTQDRGLVRFSFGYFNTEEEMRCAVTAVKEISTS